MAIAIVNPATGKVLQTYNPMSPEIVAETVARSQVAFEEYQFTSLTQRSAWLTQAAEILETESSHWGKLITLEMGKTLKSAIAEVEKSASVCRYYATHAQEFWGTMRSPPMLSLAFCAINPWG